MNERIGARFHILRCISETFSSFRSVTCYMSPFFLGLWYILVVCWQCQKRLQGEFLANLVPFVKICLLQQIQSHQSLFLVFIQFTIWVRLRVGVEWSKRQNRVPQCILFWTYSKPWPASPFTEFPSSWCIRRLVLRLLENRRNWLWLALGLGHCLW